MIIGFFDEERENLAAFREWIAAYTIQQGLEFDILSFAGQTTPALLDKYASAISFAFVSLDTENGLDIGARLSVCNPCCYVCYYSNRARFEAHTLLHSRPFEYVYRLGDQDRLNRIMDEMLSGFIQAKGVFFYESRREVLCCPIRKLLYFQSDLKHVIIRTILHDKTDSGKFDEKRLYMKLSDVEHELKRQQIGHSFIRIHKSYLVNMIHVVDINKKAHTVRLSSGEDLPISEAYYQTAGERIAAFHRLQSF